MYLEGQVELLVGTRHHDAPLRDVNYHPDQLLVLILGSVQDDFDCVGGFLLPAVHVHHLAPEILHIELDSLQHRVLHTSSFIL